MTGVSFRVPCNDVSVVDVTMELSRPASYAQICEAVEDASLSYMKGIIEYNDSVYQPGSVYCPSG